MIEGIIIGAVAVALAFAILVAIAATRPGHFKVARSLVIDAPPQDIYPLIADLRTMNTWNPFDRQDPSIKGSYSGSDSGVGAKYAFESAKAGTGFIEITEATPSSRIAMRLMMSKPITCDNRVEFLVEPRGGSSEVTWQMSGPLPLIARVFQMFCSMDRMVGGMFERGLADLRTIAENRKPA